MAEVGIRSYLNSKGFKDDEITYNNGNVMLKGKQFYGATPKADGSTYGDTNALNQAFNNYNMSDALDTFKSNLAKPRAQFSYDPNSDQAYQSALGAAQRSAQTTGNNATVRLGARGIGNSQQALTTENQIQQRSVADVNSNILPQLISQAYGRFHDQQVMDDARNNDYLNLAGTYNKLGQQDLDNQYRDNQAAEQKKQSNWDAYLKSVALTGDLGTGPKNDYSLLGDRSGNLSMAGQGYKDDMTQRGIENTRADKQLENSTRQTNASIANMGADNARSISDAALRLKFDIWEKTGVAPEGIPGVKAGTTGGKDAIKAKEESAKKMENEKSGLIGALQNNEISYNDAEKQIKSDLAVGFYTKEEAAELLEVMKTWAANAYGQRWN